MPCEPEIETKIIFRHDEPLDLGECYNFVRSPRCGAINLFAGTIRDKDLASIGQTDESYNTAAKTILKPIKSIYYEAYESMAEKQIREIVKGLGKVRNERCDEDQDFFEAKVCIELRLGFVPVGETAIIICVSSTRRNQSNWMTMSILEQIKACVAIWKKIVFTDGTEQWDLEEKSEASWMKMMDRP